MQYKVAYIRANGIECKWSYNSGGAPIIVGKSPTCWVPIDNYMWQRAKAVGFKQAFEEYRALIEEVSV